MTDTTTKYRLLTRSDMDGLVCAAVPVFGGDGRHVRCAVALQAPVARMTLAQAIEKVPRLHEAARALTRTLS